MYLIKQTILFHLGSAESKNRAQSNRLKYDNYPVQNKITGAHRRYKKKTCK